MINRVKQTANNYGEQSSDPSKAVICKDQQSSQLQIWHLMLTHKHMARQAPVADAADHQQIAAHIDWRLTLIAYTAVHLTTYN